MDTPLHHDVLIVGGGQAGAQTAILLRQLGYRGTVGIIGRESDLPYDRPPLSKEYLAGGKVFDALTIRTAAAWEELAIALYLGTEVSAIDAQAHRVEAADGRCWSYGTLVWAAGGAPRTLGCAGAAGDGVFAVRTRRDVDSILAALPGVRDVAIVGGGYVGLEVAAAMRALDLRVALVEARPRLLERVAGEALSRFYAEEHRARGVTIRLDSAVAAVERSGGRVRGLRLADGDHVAAQLVVVGIGIDPEIGPLAAAGAAIGNGVRVDSACRTTLPDIFAIGDCAQHRNAFADGHWIRLESIQNANDQAMTAARAIVGQVEAYSSLPWFWSNQYDLRLQTVGLSSGHDEAIVRGDRATRSFSVVYLREGRVIALDCVNCARDFSHGRALVASGAKVDSAALADPSRPLKSLLPAP